MSGWNAYGHTMIALFAGAAAFVGGYVAVDRLALATRVLEATVLEKVHTPPGTAYTTTIIDGRSVVRSHATGDVHGVVFETSGGTALALLSAERYASLAVGDRVPVFTRRTRIGGRLEVIDVAERQP